MVAMDSDNYGLITITEVKKIDAKGVQKHVETLASASSPEGLSCTIIHSIFHSIPRSLFYSFPSAVIQKFGRRMQWAITGLKNSLYWEVALPQVNEGSKTFVSNCPM